MAQEAEARISLAERSTIAAEAVWTKHVEDLRGKANALIQEAALKGCFSACILSGDLRQLSASKMYRRAQALAEMPEFEEVKWEVCLSQEDIGCGETNDVLTLWALWGPNYEEMPRVTPLKRPKECTWFWVACFFLAALAVAVAFGL